MMVVVSVNLDRIFALMRTLLPVGAFQKIGHYLQQSTKATAARRHLKLGFDLAWYIYFFNFQLCWDVFFDILVTSRGASALGML